MILDHYTADPLEFDRNRIYLQTLPRFHYKPRGLWVSVTGEDDWPAWCRGEDWNQCLKHCYRVTLCPRASILHIASNDELLEFHREYSAEREYFGGRVYAARPGGYFDWCQRALDWRRTADDYAGVIIAPYLWDMRLGGPQWYYGWDCASGCIWDMSAIAAIKESSPSISQPAAV